MGDRRTITKEHAGISKHAVNHMIFMFISK